MGLGAQDIITDDRIVHDGLDRYLAIRKPEDRQAIALARKLAGGRFSSLPGPSDPATDRTEDPRRPKWIIDDFHPGHTDGRGSQRPNPTT